MTYIFSLVMIVFVFNMLFFIAVKMGRPAIVVEREQVQILQNRGFTAKKMAKFFGCSDSLMYSHLKRLGMGQRRQFSTLSNEELDHLVSDIHSRHPNAGSKVRRM